MKTLSEIIHLSKIALIILLIAPANSSYSQDFSDDLQNGHKLAGEALKKLAAEERPFSYTGENGLLIAEGDSWFAYPQSGILRSLRRKHNYRTESVASNGHTLESIAYDPKQLIAFAEKLEEIQSLDLRPKAILLSAGGNDIVGEEFVMLLNHSRSVLGERNIYNVKIAEEIINVRLRSALISLIASVTRLNEEIFGDRSIPILIHGYDHAIPDGRGFLGGAWFLPGPWMQPAFTKKGYADLETNSEVVSKLIDNFNSMLVKVTQLEEFKHVCFVPLVGTLETDPQDNYKDDWADELHPTIKGFDSVAQKFDGVIQNPCNGN